MEKLKSKFLTEEVKLKYKICQESCDCCNNTLGCTKWKKIKEELNEKVKQQIEDLKTKKESLKEELRKASSSSEQEKIKKEIELINESITKTKESKNERVKDFTIRLRKDADDDTIAHEFTHVFLAWHYNFSDHHGKGEINEKKNTHFWSLKEWFLQQINN